MEKMMSSRIALGIAAGVCGTLFLGYCVYFDYQRHSDPEFKKKLRERRRAKKNAASSGKRTTVFPDIKDHEAVQRFFLQEIQLGEELLAMGDMENGVDHIANAVAVCGQPHDLLNLLQQTLQPQAFHMLVKRLPAVAPRIMKSTVPPAATASGGGNATATMQEDDVE